MAEIIHLFPEIWLEIFKRVGLRLKYIFKFSVVCKLWNEMLHTDEVFELAKSGIERERSLFLLGLPDPKWALSHPKFLTAASFAPTLIIEMFSADKRSPFVKAFRRTFQRPAQIVVYEGHYFVIHFEYYHYDSFSMGISPHPFTGRWMSVLLEPTQAHVTSVIQKIADANRSMNHPTKDYLLSELVLCSCQPGSSFAITTPGSTQLESDSEDEEDAILLTSLGTRTRAKNALDSTTASSSTVVDLNPVNSNASSSTNPNNVDPLIDEFIFLEAYGELTPDLLTIKLTEAEFDLRIDHSKVFRQKLDSVSAHSFLSFILQKSLVIKRKHEPFFEATFDFNENQQAEYGCLSVLLSFTRSLLCLLISMALGVPVLAFLAVIAFGICFISAHFYEKWSIFVFNHPFLPVASDGAMAHWLCVLTAILPYSFFFCFYFVIFFFTVLIFFPPLYLFFFVKGFYYDEIQLATLGKIYSEFRTHIVTLLQLIL